MAEIKKAPWTEWRITGLIGQGSYGSVYEIQRNLLDDEIETAAMKVLSIPQNPSDVDEMYNEGYDDESITATFNAHLKSIVAEYSLMRKMDGSANIVNCKDICYVQHDDGFGWDVFIRMELLTSLSKALPIDVSEETVVKVAKDICAALVLCKKHGIVHRDIKPQNIFVSSNGDYKLGDFGIAKTVEKTMGGTKIGTYKYMAPEVYNNQPYGSSADIYSLGLVLYWLLNERRMPFMPLPPEKLTAGIDEQTRQRRLSGEPLPEPVHGSTELKKIVLKACAYDLKDRYASAGEMLTDLNHLGNADTVFSAVLRTNDNFPTQKTVFEKQYDKAAELDVQELGVQESPSLEKTIESGEEYSTLLTDDKGDDQKDIVPDENKEKKANPAYIVLLIAAFITLVCILRSCNSRSSEIDIEKSSFDMYINQVVEVDI